MEEEKKEFRFLSDWEFAELTEKQRAVYLSMATQELERRQCKLREQMQQMAEAWQTKS